MAATAKSPAKITPSSEREGNQRELDEAAPFALAIGDVEGIDDRLHAGIGAPQGEREAEQEGEAERAATGRRDAFHLLLDRSHRIRWDDLGKKRHGFIDRSRIGEQAVDRDEGTDRREDREQAVKDDARRHREHSVLVDLLVGAPEDVPPADPRNLPGVAERRVPAPAQGLAPNSSAGQASAAFCGVPAGTAFSSGRGIA